MLTEVFDKLKSLQVVLSKKCQVEEEVNEIPKVLTTKIELLNRIKKTSADKQKNLEDVMARARDLAVRMTEAEKERETYEKQMDQIKTQREYEALDKQINIYAVKGAWQLDASLQSKIIAMAASASKGRRPVAI